MVSRGSRRLALLVKMGKVGGGGEEREKDVEIDLEDVYRENQVEWNTARNTRERERECVCVYIYVYICVCIYVCIYVCMCVIYSFLSNRNQSSEPTHQPPPPKKKPTLDIIFLFYIQKLPTPFPLKKKPPTLQPTLSTSRSRIPRSRISKPLPAERS